jgi:septal ring factor EnvC (AmiA/AmiB activator)
LFGRFWYIGGYLEVFENMTLAAARAFAVFLVFFVAVGGSRGQQQHHPVERDLKDVGQNIKREKRLLSKLKKKSVSLLETIEQINQSLQSAEEDLKQAEQQMAVLETQLAEVQKKKDRALQSLSASNQRLKRRLREMYKMGEIGWMNLLFGADSFAESIELYRILHRQARVDIGLMEETRHLRQELAQTELAIRRKKEELLLIRESTEERRTATASVKADQERALSLIRRESALHYKAVRELKRARRRLVGVMSSLEGTSSTRRGFASWKGRLRPPVKGARIEVGFGLQIDPRSKTATRHPGVDIRARKGEIVRVVYPGKVVFAKAFMGYGILVIVDHGGGYYSLYGHLGRLDVAKGDDLSVGQSVGTLGDTGSLKGPFLYFEIRQRKTPVDPQKWVAF